eukprot:TRINITY_DN9816_c0_g1_i1.p1 TRINITY_DN9816_c0_g1~~TRINITY_DN9816_c0_g1_i1.p1  ORF type:complete len:662 (+),score=136.39 TRINITY_DN9816_c0_g1_i1:41-2026(+)
MEQQVKTGGAPPSSTVVLPPSFVETASGSSTNLNSFIAAKALSPLVDSTSILSVDDGELMPVEQNLSSQAKAVHNPISISMSKSSKSGVVGGSIEIVATSSGARGPGAAPVSATVVVAPQSPSNSEEQLLEEIPSQIIDADPRMEPLIEVAKENWFKSEKCMLCAEKFTVFHRQHHCRYCGFAICATCSRFTTSQPPIRICEGCELLYQQQQKLLGPMRKPSTPLSTEERPSKPTIKAEKMHSLSDEEGFDTPEIIEQDSKRNMEQLITSKGYPFEEHQIETDDGYYLTLQRIPHGRLSTQLAPGITRRVVFLQHGFMDSGVTWVLNTPSKSLGFVLADAGFDVWIGNSRGTKKSKKHKKWKPKDVEFWNFCWDEMALYDLKACFNHILMSTRQPTLTYIGHSQGTTIAFAGFSSDPDLAAQVNLFIPLAPVAYISKCAGILRVFAKLRTEAMFRIFGGKDFMTDTKRLNEVLPGMVAPIPGISGAFTSVFLGSFCGWNPDNYNIKRLPVMLANSPGGVSVKTICHWAQLARAQVFCKYDYGKDKNREVYNSPKPPSYDVSRINIPIAIFSGGSDKFTRRVDLGRLLQELRPNCIVYHQHEPIYGHMDFIWGEDAHIKIYPKVVDLINRYSTFEMNTFPPGFTASHPVMTDSQEQMAAQQS